MAICKRILLVTFVLLCFITITTEARSLQGVATREAPKGNDDFFTPNQEHEADNDELVSVDYTPTKKNPPIHN
ncbi:hypothetical protein SO802_026184 [Lithocarpus litseifolius]|uniref:Uncharacterized protein n=1 Tax=Lithocarpus litseifolius TaxID=425828 RepID=A0AAW2C274_9ROSI